MVNCGFDVSLVNKTIERIRSVLLAYGNIFWVLVANAVTRVVFPPSVEKTLFNGRPETDYLASVYATI